MQKFNYVIINGSEFPKDSSDIVAIRVTKPADEKHGARLMTLRMGVVCYRGAFPVGIPEGGKLLVREDEDGNIVAVLPERWFPVHQDGAIESGKDDGAVRDYHEEYA